MKRSEMIKKAAEMFEQHSREQQYPGYSYEGLTETFVDIVEYLGMSPPKTRDAVLLRDSYEWEKE